MTRVELLHIPDCPNTETARRLLSACLDELGLTVGIEEKEGAFPSPTIRVDGEDVMGNPQSDAATCRLDVPTRDRILAVLRRAVGVTASMAPSPSAVPLAGGDTRRTMPRAPIDLEVLVRTAAFQLLVQRAHGISPAELAATTGIRRDKLDNLIARLTQAGCIRVDAAGMVVGSAGLSVTSDRHEIEVDGQRFWTWCAYDFFGIFGALGANGRALSPSPPDGISIEVRFAGGRPQPAEAVLFRPDSELMECCENVYEEWCPNSNLFVNRELAESWAVQHKLKGSVLSLDEAADLATAEWRSVTDAKVRLPRNA